MNHMRETGVSVECVATFIPIPCENNYVPALWQYRTCAFWIFHIQLTVDNSVTMHVETWTPMTMSQ